MISLKVSKTAMEDPAILKRLQLPLAVAQATAEHIRDRAMAGRFATSPAGYQGEPRTKSGKPRKYRVSQEYAQAAGAQPQEGGLYGSSQDFHRQANAVPGNTTGQMWDGLQIRNYGSDGAIIEFAGTSQGSRAKTKPRTVAVEGEWVVTTGKDGKPSAKRKRTQKRDEGGKVLRTAASDRVANRLKASAVFANSKIGLLQPTPDETDAQSSAVGAALATATAHCFGADGSLRIDYSGDPHLIRSIASKIRR